MCFSVCLSAVSVCPPAPRVCSWLVSVFITLLPSSLLRPGTGDTHPGQSLRTDGQYSTLSEYRASQGNILNVHSVPWSNLCLAIWKGVNSDLTIHYCCVFLSWWSLLKVWFGRYWWPGCGMWGEVISGSGHWERGRQRDEGPRHRERGVHSAMNNWNLSRIPDGAAAARKITIDVFTRDFKVYLISICLLCYRYIFQSVWWALSKCEKLHIAYYCAIFKSCYHAIYLHLWQRQHYACTFMLWKMNESNICFI